jgi:hypothetical protein
MMQSSKCKRCGAGLLWCMMPSGAKMPLDAKPKKLIQVKEGIGEMIDVYESHFSTCPAAGEFRKTK